jgi:hypothetical protein
MKTSVEDRFWAKVEKSSEAEGCWNWKGYIMWAGYGHFGPNSGSPIRAHRFAYELLVGPIPENRGLDHLCRNRACVNPDHLEVVTQKENVLRGESIQAQRARQTRCIHGHPLFGDNLYVRPNGGRPGRECRTCHRIAQRQYKARLENNATE